MKKLILVMLLLGATYATTQAQHRGRGHHDRDRDRDRYDRYDRYDDCDDDRRGRGHGRHKKVVYVNHRHRDYRRYDDCDRGRVVVVRPGIPLPPPPPLPLPPRRPRVSGVIVFGN